MNGLLLFLLVTVLFVVATILVSKRQKRPRRIMRKGKLLKSEIVFRDGEKFYVEKVAFKDWHACIHAYYLISDKLSDGHTIIDQSWNYDDFCNITIRLEDYTYVLIRQVDAIALVRSFRSIPVDDFDRIARSLIM